MVEEEWGVIMVIFCVDENGNWRYTHSVDDVKRIPQIGEVYEYEMGIEDETTFHRGLVLLVVSTDDGLRRVDLVVEELVLEGGDISPMAMYRKILAEKNSE